MSELDRQTTYWDSVAAEKVFTHPLDTERFRALTWIHELLAEFAILGEREFDAPTMNGNPARVFQILARRQSRASTHGA